MNKKVAVVVTGLVLTAGVGAACWRTVRNSVFTENACSGDTFKLTAVFLPAWDFAELRQSNGDATQRSLESSGTACARATAREACEAALAAATSKEGWSNGSHGRMPGHHYIVATRGDEVVVIDGAARLGTALAPIDSPAKAAVLAFVERGIGFSCERSVRTVEGGFEVHLVSDSCLGPADEVIGVSTVGVTTVLSSDYGRATCVGRSLNARHMVKKYAAATSRKYPRIATGGDGSFSYSSKSRLPVTFMNVM
jgi:hypothetical protein